MLGALLGLCVEYVRLKKRVFITGITGQDGSYLAELLVSKGYDVYGMIRRSSSFNTSRIDHILLPRDETPSMRLFYGDLTDGSVLNRLMEKIEPDEIYHLGAQSHVRVSFDIPEYTADVTGLGALRLLDAIRETGIKTRFYQASSSEMFGLAKTPQNEDTAFHPRSPYACAKVFGYWLTKNYREAYNLFAVNGILFNHESPRRGGTFVSKKITEAVARIKAGLQEKLYLGNLDAIRDWGYAPEYVEAMWRMMQIDQPVDLVIGTGEAHTVREFVVEAFSLVGLDWQNHVVIDERFYRPSEVPALIADAARARKLLGWKPKTYFKDLVRIMLEADLRTYGLALGTSQAHSAEPAGAAPNLASGISEP